MAKARTVLKGLQFENVDEARRLARVASDAHAGFGAIAAMAEEVRDQFPRFDPATDGDMANAASMLDGIEVLARRLQDALGPLDEKLCESWGVNFDAE